MGQNYLSTRVRLDLLQSISVWHEFFVQKGDEYGTSEKEYKGFLTAQSRRTNWGSHSCSVWRLFWNCAIYCSLSAFDGTGLLAMHWLGSTNLCSSNFRMLWPPTALPLLINSNFAYSGFFYYRKHASCHNKEDAENALGLHAGKGQRIF